MRGGVITSPRPSPQPREMWVRLSLQAWANNPALAGGRPSATAAALLAAGDRERGSVITTVRKGLAWTQGDAMRPFLAASDFSLDDLLDNAIDLFVVVPLDQVSE